MEACQVMRMILKIFWSSTQYFLPKVNGINVDIWFSMFAALLEKRLPEASENIEPLGQPIAMEDRAAWPWWKVSK